MGKDCGCGWMDASDNHRFGWEQHKRGATHLVEEKGVLSGPCFSFEDAPQLHGAQAARVSATDFSHWPPFAPIIYTS